MLSYCCSSKIPIFQNLFKSPRQYILMKTELSVLLIPLLLLLAGQASASYWFQVTDISPISMTPNSEANFTVSVKGLGSQGAYVELVFQNMSQGIDTSCEKLIEYVFPTGTTKYNCSVTSGDIPPGNYSFVVDVAAAGAPSGKKTAYVDVVAAMAGTTIEPTIEPQMNLSETENPSESMQESEGPSITQANQTSAEPMTNETPGLEAVPAIFALLLIMRRMRS